MAMPLTSRMVIVFALLVILPESIALYLLESGRVETLRTYHSIHLAVNLALLVPLARLAGYLVMGRDIRELFKFCQSIRNGRYDRTFTLPNEDEDEPDMVKLKRLLNWMSHSLQVREARQRFELGKTKELGRRYRHMALQDELTRLFNRRHFNEQVREMIARGGNGAGRLGLMLIDVDNFKMVNDTLGHQAGDDTLRNLAGVLRSSVRSREDLVFRLGGDEFAVLLPQLNTGEGRLVAERIRIRYRASSPDFTSLSIGLAFHQERRTSVEDSIHELIENADQCLYGAKKSGRNAIVVAGEGAVRRGPGERETGAAGLLS